MCIPSQVICDYHSKVINGIHIFEDHSLKGVRRLNFIRSLLLLLSALNCYPILLSALNFLILGLLKVYDASVLFVLILLLLSALNCYPILLSALNFLILGLLSLH